jgi:hypothetical protein
MAYAPQVLPALPPMPICIGPAAPAKLAPDRTPWGGRAAVVGLDLADGRQHRPRQARAAVGRRLVDGQQLRRDVLLGAGARRPPADQRGGQPRGYQGRDQGEDAEQEFGHHLADRWYFRTVESVDRIGLPT